jgi:iron complex transport system ATP-binding protein
MKISISSLRFAYNGQEILQGVDLEVAAGEFLALIGPNGSGKSTLLRQISGVLKPNQGAVYLDMSEIARLRPAELARHLAALEQEHGVGFDFTVRELVSWGRLPHRKRFSRWSSSDEAAVVRALSMTGIEKLAHRPVHQLSGGERQLAFLSMTLAQEPKVLLLDEPTAHLDINYQLAIMELIRDQVARGVTVIAAIHDLNLAARYADRVAALSQGRIVAVGPTQETLTEELIHSVWGVKVRVLRDQGSPWIIPENPANVKEAEAFGRRDLPRVPNDGPVE